MGSAGIRIGYLFGARKWIAELEKLRLPFMLNHFAMEAGIAMLSDPMMKDFVKGSCGARCDTKRSVSQATSGV